MSGDRLRMDRGELARRLLAATPDPAHRAAVQLLADFRGGVLLDYVAVRKAVRHDDDWATVQVDWRALLTLADEMAGAHDTNRMRAAYQLSVHRGDGHIATGTAIRHLRHVLAMAAGIALGEISPDEAAVLAAAFTAVGRGDPSADHGGR